MTYLIYVYFLWESMSVLGGLFVFLLSFEGSAYIFRIQGAVSVSIWASPAAVCIRLSDVACGIRTA